MNLIGIFIFCIAIYLFVGPSTGESFFSQISFFHEHREIIKLLGLLIVIQALIFQMVRGTIEQKNDSNEEISSTKRITLNLIISLLFALGLSISLVGLFS